MRNAARLLVGVALFGLGLWASPAHARAHRKAKAAPANTVALTQGFKTSEAGGELFLTFDRSIEAPRVDQTASGLVVTMTGVRITKPFRLLDPRCFATVVRTVTTKRQGRDLVMTIELKEKAQPKIEVHEVEGQPTLTLAFPAGKPEDVTHPAAGVVAAAASDAQEQGAEKP